MFALGHGRSPVQPEYALQSYFGVGYYLRYQGEGDPMTKIAESLQFKFVYGDKAYTANSLANALQFEDILQAKGITEYKVFIYDTVIIAMGQSLENAIDARELFYTKFVPMSEDDFTSDNGGVS
jgi:hypothetical protein